tara:strand:+ start:16 stop:321 length:306 start_codon:yes stop_codon:yes gene_type:complete
MTEMEQEQRVNLYTDEIIRKALDLRIKNNVLIADFMDLRNTGMSIYKESDYKYHKSWDWLMPVIDKCYQEHMSKHIADAVMTCDINKVYKVVVEFINQLNK